MIHYLNIFEIFLEFIEIFRLSLAQLFIELAISTLDVQNFIITFLLVSLGTDLVEVLDISGLGFFIQVALPNQPPETKG